MLVDNTIVNIHDRAAIAAHLLELATVIEKCLVQDPKNAIDNTYILFNKDGNHGHVLHALDGVPPEIAGPAIQRLLEIADVRAPHMSLGLVIHVAEAWAAKVNELPLPGEKVRPPSQREDRSEAYVIEAKSRFGEKFFIIQHFDRDADGRAVFADPPKLASAKECYVSNFLDPLFSHYAI